MVRAGDPAYNHLTALSPVIARLSCYTRNQVKMKTCYQELQGSCSSSISASSKSKVLQGHFLKQIETGVIISIQTNVTDVLGTADL